MKFIFDSHGGDSTLNDRTGQSVTVLRALTEQEADIFDVGKMFRIRFEDGFETDAFADELTLDEITPLERRLYVADEVTPFTEQQWEELKASRGATAPPAPEWFAITRWAVEDVMAAAEERGIKLTVDQARAWWHQNERVFHEMLVERGNEILADMDFTEEIVCTK